MDRRQLVELEDLEWFPAVIRDGGTACLRAFGQRGAMGRFMAPPLAEALRRTGHRKLVDLCSGGAGPLPEILKGLAAEGLEVQAVMTDKYPNMNALRRAEEETAGRAKAWPASVDATDVPETLEGFRLILNAFHHFPPALARGILADAVRKRVPIAVVEVVERTPWAITSIIISPLVAMLLTPWIRPRRASWWFFTFVLPLIPAMLLWDGLVSCFRVYTPRELRRLVADIEGADDFVWTEHRAWLLPMPMRTTIFIGTPKEAAAAAEAA